MTSGLLELYKPQHRFKPGTISFRRLFFFPLQKKPGEMFLPFATVLQKPPPLRSNPPCPLSSGFHRYPIPLTQTAHPNSLSSPVRYGVRFLLSSLHFRGRAASENVLKVVVDSADESHAWEGWAVSIRSVRASAAAAHIHVTRKGREHMWPAELRQAHV